MNEIFVYGTLGDPEYQIALYDRTLPTRPAKLTGWSVVVSESGYLTMIPDPGQIITGSIITVDGDVLNTSDAWEEVPLYARIIVEALEDDGTPVMCYAYARPSASRARPAPGATSAHERVRVLAAIRAFRLSRE